MSSYEEFKKELLEDPEVKAAYDELQPEYDIIQAMIDARKSQHMTQKDLSEATGITQADISRIENGTRNPSLEMVKRLAAGIDPTGEMPAKADRIGAFSPIRSAKYIRGYD